MFRQVGPAVLVGWSVLLRATGVCEHSKLVQTHIISCIRDDTGGQSGRGDPYGPVFQPPYSSSSTLRKFAHKKIRLTIVAEN